jgi:hypothetical protein
MLRIPQKPPIDPCRVDDSRDFEVGLLALYIKESWQDVRELCPLLVNNPGWTAEFSPEDLDDFRSAVEAALFICRDLHKRYDKTYVMARDVREYRVNEQLRAEAVATRCREKMVFAGSDTVPTYWSNLGWIEDHPDFPLAMSRDSGHLILAAGAQGSGKTVMSTLIAQDSQQAEPPLTSDAILPTAFCFFHIEENDRLPQLLDGLKKNPKQADLDVLKKRLNRVVDFYHAVEKLSPAAQLLDGDKASSRLGRWRLDLLNNSDAASRILSELRASGKEWHPAGDGHPVHEAITYVENHADRMDYAEARREGRPIGSGHVEATGKSLFEVRMKRSGSRWKDASGEDIVRLRALGLSDRWDAAMSLLLAPFRKEVQLAA